MTLPLSLVWTVFGIVIEKSTPSGTGRKSLFSAAARRRSRSWPPMAAIFFEASSVNHPLISTRGSPSYGSSNLSRDHELVTTCHGYPADGCVWMMNAPIAPFCAAIMYL